MDAEVGREEVLMYELDTVFDSPLLSEFKKKNPICFHQKAMLFHNKMTLEQFECHSNKTHL